MDLHCYENLMEPGSSDEVLTVDMSLFRREIIQSEEIRLGWTLTLPSR
jgi:hypothetical protein